MKTGLGRYKPHRAAAASFVPTDIAGCIGWWDPSDAATITASSGSVSQLNDKSSTGAHLTQGTGSAQPTTGTRTINSLNALDYDAGDFLRHATLPSHSQPNTIITVALNDALGSNFVYDGVSARNAMGRGLLGGGGVECFAGGVGLAAASPEWSTTLPHLVTVAFNGASSEIWNNTVSVDTGDVGAAALTGFTMGASSSGTSGWNGLIAETIVYNSVLNSTDRGSVETYLKTKWGTP